MSQVPEKDDQTDVDSVPDDGTSTPQEGPAAGGAEAVQSLNPLAKYDVLFLVKKAKYYNEENWSLTDQVNEICATCGKTLGAHYGGGPEIWCDNKKRRRFMEDKKATEVFVALRIMLGGLVFPSEPKSTDLLIPWTLK
jgi:hypothetical protein